MSVQFEQEFTCELVPRHYCEESSFPFSLLGAECDPASLVVTRPTILTICVAILLSPNIHPQLPILDKVANQTVPLQIGRWLKQPEWLRRICTNTEHPGRHQKWTQSCGLVIPKWRAYGLGCGV